MWKYTVRVWDRASLLSIPVRKRPFGGCLHAFNIFERIQPSRETIIISNETMPVVWRALEQGSPGPKPTRIKSGNDTEDKHTSLSQLAC